MTTILACIDDSRYTQSVLDHAHWASTRVPEPQLEVLHAISRHPEQSGIIDWSGSIGVDAGGLLLAELTDLDEKQAKLEVDKGNILLKSAYKHLQDRGATAVNTRLRHGQLVDVIDNEDMEPDLIVVGKRGENADFAKLHLGTNLERVVRASDKPVLVAARDFNPIERVLIAFDGSKTAYRVVKSIAEHELFNDHKLECHVIMVGDNADDEDKAALHWAGKILEDAGINQTSHLIAGDPNDAIPAYAAEANMDMVAMGAWGHSKIRKLLLGSTSTTLIRSCLLPILVFH